LGRAARVLPIWEGPTNVLSVDVLRTLAAARPILDRAWAAAQALPPADAGVLAATLARLTSEVSADPRSPAVVAGARGLALRLGYALAAALLTEHAAWSGTDADMTVAALWTRRHLGGADIATDADYSFDAP